MSIIQIMVTIIIVTILVTVILGVASYGAYWLRRQRRPAPRPETETGPRFFFRYVPDAEAAEAGAATDQQEPEPAAESEPSRGTESRRSAVTPVTVDARAGV